MKKIFSAVVLYMSIISAIQGQENQKKDNRNKLHFGAKAGINNSNVYEEKGKFTTEPKYGFAGGLFLSIPIGKYLGVQPNILLSQKGFHAQGELMDSGYDLKRTTTFIDIPLAIEFKPLKALTILAGPQYSYLINQTDVLKSGSNTSVQEQEFENDNIRKNILSGLVGLDVHLSKWVLSGRYNFDLQQNNGNGTSETPRYKNIWLQGTIGMEFL